jgi:hypothetical protein
MVKDRRPRGGGWQGHPEVAMEPRGSAGEVARAVATSRRAVRRFDRQGVFLRFLIEGRW